MSDQIVQDAEEIIEQQPEPARSEVSTEVKSSAPVAVAASNTVNGFLQVIQSVVENPNMNPEVIHRLIDAQERVLNKNAEMAFHAAMARLQPRLPRIEKKGKIDFTSKKTGEQQVTPYARYEDIDQAIRPLLSEEGFSLSFNTEWGNDGVMASGTLAHREGHHQQASIRLPLDTSGSKNNIQAMGSTISYARRYLTKMLLNIVEVGEDDDGATSEPLLEEQLQEINELLERTGTEATKFCDALGLPELEKIQQKDFTRALNALKSKEALQKKKKAETESGTNDQPGGRVSEDQPRGQTARSSNGSDVAGRDGVTAAPPGSCSACGGKGVIEDAEGKGPCAACNGRGL